MKLLKDWGVLFVGGAWLIGAAYLFALNLILPHRHQIAYFNKCGHRPWYRDGDVYAMLMGVATMAAATIGLSILFQSWLPLVAVPASFAASTLLLHWYLDL